MSRKGVFRDQSTGDFDDGAPIAVFPAAVASVFGRTGAVAAVAGDYFGAIPAALTGATQAARFVGATTSGAPASGTFAVGDVVVARDGHVFVCTTAGSPGTFTDVCAGASVSYATPAIVLGSSAAAGAASTVIRSDSTIAAFDATAPTTQAFGDSAAVGTAAFAARRDHKHAMPATPVTTINKTGSTALTGAVTLTGGTNVTLTQSGQDISIAASGGSSGVTQSYIGYNTVGGTTESIALSAGKQVLKPVTLSAAGLLTSVELYCAAGTSDAVDSAAAVVFADNAGAPGICIAAGPTGAAGNVLDSTGRWLARPLGVWLPAASYWIGVFAYNGIKLYYDGSGGDYTAAFAVTNVYDPGTGGGVNYTNSTRKYSVRGNLIQ